MSRFAGKVVLVTGGTSGIGKATAIAFAREGAKVVLSGRRAPEGEQVVEEIRAVGGEATFVRADVANEEEVKKLVEATVAKYGRLDVAFNNAGVELKGSVTDFAIDDYRKVFDVNVQGVFLSMKHEIPEMLKTGGGSIVNTSSIAGNAGMPGASVYVASKHAVEGLTKTAALELATQGIRVNSVAPAGIETEMYERFTERDREIQSQFIAQHPMQRVGTVDEVAAAVLFLASDAASFVTGISLPVDAGWLAR